MSYRVRRLLSAEVGGETSSANGGRVDNGYGDRNLVCTCAPIDSYRFEALEGSLGNSN